ncbi:helix-turn-helix domain-containing protein [Cyclobacterium salsum]
MHERGLSQKALSQYLGVSSSRISEYLKLLYRLDPVW